MDEVESIRQIRCGFNEILAGYTPLSFHRDDLYIKHFATRDQIEVDSVYQSNLDRMKARGVPTSADRAKELAEEKLWTSEDEDFLKNKQQEVEDFRKGKKLLMLKQHLDAQQDSIDKSESEYLVKLMQKNELFGKTAEFFANKRVSDFCIVHSIFRDPEFRHPYFKKEDIFNLDDDLMDDITQAYQDAVSKFEESSLKKIALSNIFQNYYYLAKSVYEFYGRAIASLTFYQVQLVTFGDYYKSVLFGQANPPPSEFTKDPEKLEEWINGSGHARKLMEQTIGKTDSGEGRTMTTIVGAQPEDLKYLGIKEEGEGVSLTKELQKSGGHLNKEDLMKLMGVRA